MSATAAGQGSKFELISQTARQRLRARVADADGDIEAVAGEIRQKLDELDHASSDDGGVQGQGHADRAFMVAQLSYLDHLFTETQQSQAPERVGLLARMREVFSGSRASN